MRWATNDDAGVRRTAVNKTEGRQASPLHVCTETETSRDGGAPPPPPNTCSWIWRFIHGIWLELFGSEDMMESAVQSPEVPLSCELYISWSRYLQYAFGILPTFLGQLSVGVCNICFLVNRIICGILFKTQSFLCCSFCSLPIVNTLPGHRERKKVNILYSTKT